MIYSPETDRQRREWHDNEGCWVQEVEVKSVRLQALQDVIVHSSDSDDKLKSTQVRF
jgi:hypothetical protein